MLYNTIIKISTNRRHLYLILLLLPFSYTLEKPYNITILHQTEYPKKLITAYAFYIAFAKEYAQVFKKILSASEKSAYWRKLVHETVLTTHNALQNKQENILVNKENSHYEELPYLYFKKNLTTARKKILSFITLLNTQYLIEQSSIIHCLNHTFKQIEKLEKAIIQMPEYYQEQIKIATKKESFITQFLPSGIGFIAKKIIPFF